jgi:hypothetical protein
MCDSITSNFNVKLTATAKTGDGCETSAFADASVTVLGQYNVTITPVSDVTSFCSPQGSLTFEYQVSSEPSTDNLQLALDGNTANCSLSSSTGRAYVLCKPGVSMWRTGSA